MGYEIESSAYITFRWVSGQQNPLDVAVHSLHAANLLDDHADLVEGGSAQVVASALADALGASDESPYVTVGDGLVAIYVSANDRASDADRVLKILAESGATGEVECCGEDGALWRWRLADGTLHEDDGRVLYAGDVDTTAWLVQLQAADDHELDMVAVVAAECDGIPVLARWCRTAIADHVEAGLIAAVDVTALHDGGVVDLWTHIVGGVRYSIRRVLDTA